MRSNKYVVAEWSEHPYTSYDRRSVEVQHRVVMEAFDSGATDVTHEVRSLADEAKESEEWTAVAAYEQRSGHVNELGKTQVLRE